ncbi:hypothetical protein FHR24_000383 [Wenyingzhuangia heitensis]|uniref:Outer membrane protein beta-barrel domain-containing protein n=1 Tax=Wenyingzhuangia heitensis TaxID=1487859 RepID=A0ABX0U6G5_9FLAO|nr:outer membrane beta-barrel protein [Wenyingzhuangia heitensis]NIJ43944.1 hypothetical protein [Wenyingzhuangia heitensis]
MEPKNIERLYQEKLRDLEINPSAAVWSKIEGSLVAQQNATKGFVWYWTSGAIAALLLLGFFIIKQNATQPIYNHAYLKQASTPLSTKKDSLLNTNTLAFLQKTKKKVKHQSFKKKTVTSSKNAKLQKLDNTIAFNQKTETNPHSKNSKPKKVLTTNLQNKTILVPKKKLEEKTIKSIKKQKSTKKGWSIAPVISQYYYGAFSNDSPVDSRLDNAEKTGEMSTAFGLNIAYNASDKLRIKTGIHRINLLQTTSGNLVSGIQANSSFANSTQQISRDGTPLLEESRSSDSENLSALSFVNNPNSELKQTIGYIEIPVEIDFKLIEARKFTIYAVGGLSTLFLTENKVEVQQDQFILSEGEANNLNSLNFSFNIGTDFEYHFSKKWFLNLAPSLKIQTQTFNSSNNNPYLLGVSSGINYKF